MTSRGMLCLEGRGRGRVRQSGWDEEAEAGWDGHARGVGVSEGYEDGGAGFGGEKLCGVGVEGCEQAARYVEWSGEEDGVEGL